MYELGINLAFPPKRIDQAAYYENLMDKASRQGLTIYRLWLSDFSFNYYSFRGETYDFNMRLLERVVALGRARGLRVIPVLFDFNEFTTTKIHWRDYEHTFQTSFISNFLKEPKEFFEPDNLGIGLSKFHKTGEVLEEGDVYAWELFNEVDLVKGFERAAALSWAAQFTSEIRRASDKPVYLSYADPNNISRSSDAPADIQLAIHTYNWPYDEFYKNLIYWQSKYPLHWVMEFGDRAATAPKLLVALLASFILNRRRQVAMPWYWDVTLEAGVYPRLKGALDQLCEYVGLDDCYRFTGDLGGNFRAPRYGRVRDTLKLAGLRGVLSKGLTTLRALNAGQRGGCCLRFENDRQLIVIEADFLRPSAPEHDGHRLLKACDVGEVTLKVYARS